MRLTIDEAQKLAAPNYMLTEEILNLYDDLIRTGIRQGQSSVKLKFQQEKRSNYHDMPGFPPGMPERQGLVLLGKHYRLSGFNVSGVKYNDGGPDPRDRVEPYSYIIVSGWVE